MANTVTLSPYNLTDHPTDCSHSITIQSHGPRQVQSLYHHTISWTTANRSHSVIIQSHSWTTATVVSLSPYSLMDHTGDCSQSPNSLVDHGNCSHSVTIQSHEPRQLQSLCHHRISLMDHGSCSHSPLSVLSPRSLTRCSTRWNPSDYSCCGYTALALSTLPPCSLRPSAHRTKSYDNDTFSGSNSGQR